MSKKIALLAALGILAVGFIAGLAVAWCLIFLGAPPYWVGLAQGVVQVMVTTILFKSPND